MPVDPSHNPLTRRTNRKLTSDEEIDSRRARGESVDVLVCAGDVLPYVPMAAYPPDKGRADMGQRIRQLEDALAIFQSGVSNEPHPLLREELLSIKFGPEKGHVPEKEAPVRKDSIEPPIDAFGTMTIGESGEGKYFGPSAGSEAGADLEQLETGVEDETYIPISREIARLSASFPFGAQDNIDKPLDFMLEHLPPEPRAWSLCETYMEQATWAFRPIRRDELIDDMLSPVYKVVKDRSLLSTSPVSAHKLAALYFVFSAGALVDLTLEPYSQEAETYYHLGRACLSLRSVLDSPEISTVQAILLMAFYHANAGNRYTMDSAWALTSLGAKLAQGLGLHRDSSRWQMDPKIVQRRRGLFWELFSHELFYSFALGRPPSIRLSYVDCEFPDDDEATLDAQGNTLVGLMRWKYEFSKEIFASVIELSLTAQAPQYSTILELDRKLREKTFFPHLNAFISPEDEEITPSVYMKRCLLGQYRSISKHYFNTCLLQLLILNAKALLYLHRSFFAQAMLDHPVNPLQSPYSPSFLAAYRCASGVIKSSLNHYDRFPELCGRWWGIWTHCELMWKQIIVGCIVTRSPSSSMAASAFIELGLACDLFEKGATHSRRARSGLAILYKMREKAFQVYSQFRSGNIAPNRTLSVGKPDYGDDELALFGGQTRVLVSKLLSKYMKTRKQSQSSSSSAPASSVSSPSSEESRVTPSVDLSREVHPSLVEYLAMYPPSNAPSRHSPGNDGSVNNLASNPNINPASSTSIDQSAYRSTSNSVDQSSYQSWHPPSLFTPLAPETFTNIASEFQPFTSTNQFDLNRHAPPVETKAGPTDTSLVDLGMMMTGESGIDEQWMSFMRDSGFLQADSSGHPVYTTSPPTYNSSAPTNLYQL
uniref:Xylanolytic transcriptional activator regulatory domain-containing protein n=1 Tax=Psilocybe cubensis TaxID=181762 RepID=A0A8H8CL84_PSICU